MKKCKRNLVGGCYSHKSLPLHFWVTLSKLFTVSSIKHLQFKRKKYFLSGSYFFSGDEIIFYLFHQPAVCLSFWQVVTLKLSNHADHLGIRKCSSSTEILPPEMRTNTSFPSTSGTLWFSMAAKAAHPEGSALMPRSRRIFMQSMISLSETRMTSSTYLLQ